MTDNNNNEEIETPWSTVGAFTFYRTYSRQKDGRNEEWHETVDRVLDASRNQLNVGFTEEEEERLRTYMLKLKGTVAGRFLWQLGTSTVDKLGLPSLQNCFSGRTTLLTDRGVVSLKSLSQTAETFRVWAKGAWHKAYARSFGTQSLYRVLFKKPGRSTYRFQAEVTGNHRWELLDGTVTSCLKVGDRVPREHVVYEHDRLGFVHGLVFGDGSESYRYSNGDYSFCIRLCGKKAKYKDLFDKYLYQPNCDGDPVAYIRTSVNLKEVPTDTSTSEYLGSFVRGWMAADGSITSSGSVALSSQNAEAIEWLYSHAAYGGVLVVGSSTENGDTNFGPRSAPLIKVTLADTPQYLEVEEIHPLGDDEVYCAVVDGIERFTLENGLLTCNCAYVSINHPTKPFTWAFSMLMLGCGVGYSIEREHVYKLPKVRKGFRRAVRLDESGADFIVPDSREGWVALLHRLLRSAFYRDESSGFSYSTQLVRGKGAPIKGFGGIASGPEDLCRGIDLIGGILESRAGKQLRPVDCLDIMNIIGQIVVSGNVRRSAQIAIGDQDDAQYLKSKMWKLGNIPNWRSSSNNSVVCNDIHTLPETFWDTYAGGSECFGLINLKLSREVGRLGDTQYPDPLVNGFNP